MSERPDVAATVTAALTTSHALLAWVEEILRRTRDAYARRADQDGLGRPYLLRAYLEEPYLRYLDWLAYVAAPKRTRWGTKGGGETLDMLAFVMASLRCEGGKEPVLLRGRCSAIRKRAGAKTAINYIAGGVLDHLNRTRASCALGTREVPAIEGAEIRGVEPVPLAKLLEPGAVERFAFETAEKMAAWVGAER
jgi:hypothetical protein